MLSRICDQILHKLFGEIHVAVQIAKRHLRLNHPEVTRMAGRLGVLGPERWAESVNSGQRQGERFRFQLAANGQIGRSGEEILREIDLPVFLRRILDVDRGNAKQFSRALAIAAGDNWRVDINETALLEKLMNGKGQSAAHAKNATEEI